MIFYKCETCGLIASELFKWCPSCGVESVKTKEIYVRQLREDKEFKIISKQIEGEPI